MLNYNLDNAPAEIFLTMIQSTTTSCKCKPKCSKHVYGASISCSSSWAHLPRCKESLSVYNAIKIRELLQGCNSKALLKAISTCCNILEFSSTRQWTWKDYEVNIFFTRVSCVNHIVLCPGVNPILFNAAPMIFLYNKCVSRENDDRKYNYTGVFFSN